MGNSMDSLENLGCTAEPAFACDGKGTIIAWNANAERLLGYSASDMIGKHCYEVLDGRDVFDNRFCDMRCAIQNMIHRQEPVHHFRLSLCTASSRRIDVSVSVFAIFGNDRSEQTVVHVLQPLEKSGDKSPPCEPGRFECFDTPEEPAKDNSASTELTARENEVLRILAAGATTPEVAERLCISEATVRNHIRNILNKLDVHSRLEAVCLAIQRRML